MTAVAIARVVVSGGDGLKIFLPHCTIDFSPFLPPSEEFRSHFPTEVNPITDHHLLHLAKRILSRSSQQHSILIKHQSSHHSNGGSQRSSGSPNGRALKDQWDTEESQETRCPHLNRHTKQSTQIDQPGR